MILASLKNFQSTYIQVIQLVLKNDKRELITIAFTYLLSILSFGAAFFLLLALIKSTVVTGDFSLSKPLVVDVMGYHFNFPKLVGLCSLLILYLFSSFTTYVVERRWYQTIQKIVNNIVLDCSDAKCREVRTGGVATMRVSAILLATLSPALIAVFAFILLIYFDWKMATLTVLIVGAAVYLNLLLGRTTKRISTAMLSGDDDDSISSDEDSAACPLGQNGNDVTRERLEFISNILKLKARSRLIANVLFVFFVVGMLLYFMSAAPDETSVYRLIVSSGLIFLCFNGIKIVGSKTVPLSRQYMLVKDFISAAR